MAVSVSWFRRKSCCSPNCGKCSSDSTRRSQPRRGPVRTKRLDRRQRRRLLQSRKQEQTLQKRWRRRSPSASRKWSRHVLKRAQGLKTYRPRWRRKKKSLQTLSLATQDHARTGEDEGGTALAALEKQRDELQAKLEHSAEVEQRLKQENEDMERELHEAQSRWKQQIVKEQEGCEEQTQAYQQSIAELGQQIGDLEKERDALSADLERVKKMEARLSEENKDMETELYNAQARWREQIKTAEQNAEAAKADQQKEVAEMKEKLKSAEAAQVKAEQAAKTEQRLREDNEDMEKELHRAQEKWREQVRDAEKRAEEALAANRKHAEELQSAQKKSAQAMEDKSAEFEQLEAELEQSRQQMERRHGELHASSEVEAQLRRELTEADKVRAQLDERVAELALQLERAQAAYAEAAQEIGAMSSRFHELEWGSQAKSSSEEVLRRELADLKDRHADTEKRLNEVTWMRDYALQQAEEARAETNRLRKEAEKHEEAGGAATASPNGGEGATQLKSGPDDNSLQATVKELEAKHAEDLQRTSAMHRDELEYLKKKLDEKDKKLEVLTCERNAFRLECADRPKPAAEAGQAKGSQKKDATALAELPDLEEGLELRSKVGPSDDWKTNAAHCLNDSDVLLRRFTRLLYISTPMRSVFYGYLFVLHIWLWIVLHHTAASRQ
eukprot:TRINITY_DN4546_c0_g1_i16.p1 TRINITY_DN4546_c0_g1~~TRINITY_DN4546_c0_g1_i16.p1  ORF type:complete len:672 (-),score=215.63 TRINITY_DN4546_c0_g1_i16:23-2038(-)